jgi:hypothetical protein
VENLDYAATQSVYSRVAAEEKAALAFQPERNILIALLSHCFIFSIHTQTHNILLVVPPEI